MFFVQAVDKVDPHQVILCIGYLTTLAAQRKAEKKQEKQRKSSQMSNSDWLAMGLCINPISGKLVTKLFVL